MSEDPEDQDDTTALSPSDEGEDYFKKWKRNQERILALLDPFFKERIQDWKGHFKNGEVFYRGNWWAPPEERIRSIFTDAFSIKLEKEETERMVAAIEQGSLLAPPVVFNFGMRDLSCYYCDQSLRLGFDGQRLLVVGNPCPYADGLVTEWELNVPSGKIAIANDLRDWFPVVEDYSVNALIGQHMTTLAYAKVGMSHGSVGNTCPSVYRSGDRYVIGSYSEEIWDRETNEGKPNPEPCPWGDEVASICTDLWWYSIVDADELRRRIAHYTPDIEFGWTEGELKYKRPGEDKFWHLATLVDVKPGVYHFRHPCGVDRDAPIVEFATFEWVREPDPLFDYVAREKALHFTATECLIQHCLDWPTLHMGLRYDDPRGKNLEELVKMWEAFSLERKADCLARAADHVMCVIGNGVEWHENGFPRTTLSDEARRLAKDLGTEGVVLPFGEKRRHWYPLSKRYSALCVSGGVSDEYRRGVGLKNLGPSFVLLGLNICQNAIRAGENPRLNTDVWPPAYEIPWCRERLELFGRCYKGLRQKYPDLVFDAEFDAWMNEVDFDKYVTEFDFGPARPPEEKWGPPPATVKQGDYFEFDARKLKDGSFCWHPKIMGGANAHKEDAHRYSINILMETLSPLGHLLHDYLPGLSNIPLWVVGRVVRGTGDGYLSKELEVAFDYGTLEMTSRRWSFFESEMKALRQFNDRAEYEELLGKCKTYFAEVEAEVDAQVKKKNASEAPVRVKKTRKAKKVNRADRNKARANRAKARDKAKTRSRSKR